MLTAYDQYTAEIFDQAGIEVLLVGDSASNNVFGNETSLPVTVDELLPLCRAVARSARRALVVADLPFGSYEVSAQQAVATGVRFLKEGLAHASRSKAESSTPRPSAPWSRPASPSWRTSVSPRRANTPSAATASRAAAMTPSG